jgi:FkbH-like protein
MKHSVKEYISLIDILEDRAVQQGDQVIYRFLEDGDEKEISLTHQQLLQESNNLASRLLIRAKPGDRAMILMPSCLEFIIAFFACLRSGVIAVPVYPPKKNKKEKRLVEIALDCTPNILLTINEHYKKTEEFRVGSYLPENQVMTIVVNRSLCEKRNEESEFPNILPNTVAFLQYTSGSTGTPKGVMVTHHNLVFNSFVSAKGMGNDSNSSLVSWLPLYHDMGLIGGVLQPLYCGYPVTLMAPTVFLHKPILWLRAISKYRATCSGAPNFAYDLLALTIKDEDVVELDLSSWQVAFCGAEPISVSTLESFFEKFSRIGLKRTSLYPCYGMAEATLYITGLNQGDELSSQTICSDALYGNNVVKDKISDKRTREIVCCGRPDESDRVCIVSPDSGHILQDNQIGEIWFSSDSVAKGYWNNEQKTIETFENKLPSLNDNRSYLRTGDLGYLSEGCLYVTGRLKDVIIVRGANHYPQDIEKTVSQAHEALNINCAAAFGISVDDVEQVVVVQEVKRAYLRKLDTQEIYLAVQEAVYDEHGLRIHNLVLVRPASVPKTTSGKIERRNTKKLYLDGQFKIVWQSCVSPVNDDIAGSEKGSEVIKGNIDRAEFIAKFTKCISETLNIDETAVPLDAPMTSFGLDSVSLVTVFSQLEETYEVPLSPTLVYSYPTILALADAVSKKESEMASSDSRYEVNQTNEPIAIVGMAGKLPCSENLDEFWHHLDHGNDLITEIPAERWDWQSLDIDDPIKWGGFMPGIDEFDAPFFGISPHEAALMDPQQRLFLQTVWQTLEDASIDPKALAGSATGVFVGVSTVDYYELSRVQDVEIEGHSSMGCAHSILPNRVSYLLNLRGPSEPVDTACSSSLVAIHRAVNSIYNGDCDMAIAGGVNAMLTPSLHMAFGQAGMLSKDGQCKTFAASANGYVRGEGVGAIFLKRLSQAEADGDQIYAVIKGSAINHGGTANSLTAPNVLSQQDVIVKAYEKADIDPGTVSYIEAHGTGTPLGDPAEINGLKGAFDALTTKTGNKNLPEASICIGSVKTNIGHLESAAGIASVLKVLLAIKNQTLPATLHCDQVNPHIDLSGSPFYLISEKQEWLARCDDSGQRLPRRAGISSFGFGGVNSHLVIEEYISSHSNSEDTCVSDPTLIVLSAKNEDRLRARVVQLLHFLKSRSISDDILMSLAYTLQIGREAMDHRLAVLVNTPVELIEKLQSHLDTNSNQRLEGVLTGNVNVSKSEAVTLFTQDEDIGELYDIWFAKKKYVQLLSLWVNGLSLEWDRLYTNGLPQKIRIPTYPFAKNRYWIPVKELKRGAISKSTPDSNWIHPVLHQNCSDINGLRFRSALSGEEFYLKDHQVHQRKTLPAVAYLEMARCAAIEASGREQREGGTEVIIENVIWSHPMTVSKLSSIYASLQTKGGAADSNDVEGNEFLFQISNEDASVRYSQGQVKLTPLQSGGTVVDLASLKSRCPKSISVKNCYKTFQSIGLEYGPAHQSIRSLWFGEDSVLAELILPAIVSDNTTAPYPLGEWFLHPTILDGALQSILGLLLAQSSTIPLVLPFALKKARILHPCTKRMWVSVQNKNQKGQVDSNQESSVQRFDLSLYNEKSQLCVELIGLRLRALQEEGNRKSTQLASIGHSNDLSTSHGELYSLKPVWNATNKIQSNSQSIHKRALLIGSDNEVRNQLLEGFDRVDIVEIENDASELAIQEQLVQSQFNPENDHLIWLVSRSAVASVSEELASDDQIHEAIQGFRLVKALLAEKMAVSELNLSVIVQGAMQVTSNDAVDPASASVAGMLGCLAKEYPRWTVTVLDLESSQHQLGYTLRVPTTLCTQLLSSLPGQDNYFSCRNDQWYNQELLPIQIAQSQKSAYRQDGVYVVIGGAGGLGEAWTESVVRQCQGQVIWLGRSPMNDTIAKKQERISAFGPKPDYISVDATEHQALQTAYESIRSRYGDIHGVVHSALVLADQSISMMEEVTYRSALNAKVYSSVHLASVFKNEPLDFIVFFSSLNSFLKPAGQSNYAAGCCYQDSFAKKLSETLPNTNVRVINWGYWGSVGVVSSNEYRDRMKRVGLGSIEPNEGTTVLNTLLSGTIDQLALIKVTSREVLNRFNIDNKEQLEYIPPKIDKKYDLSDTLSTIEVPDQLLSYGSEVETLEQLLANLLFIELDSMGVFTQAQLGEDLQSIATGLGIKGFYYHWLETCLDLLANKALIEKVGPDRIAVTEKALKLDRCSVEHSWKNYLESDNAKDKLGKQLELITATMAVLKRIVCGETLATDVIFANGSMSLVEGVYQNNPQADYFNDIVCQSLLDYLQFRLKNEPNKPLRILEIGAGTGGTSRLLFKALEPHREFIEEYCYTDVSQAFLSYGEQSFHSIAPYLTCKLFNVARPLKEQDVDMGAYDIVVASNVLHATNNIRQTLQNTKALLCYDGVLLLNEINNISLFTHLTFGLLEGWWLYEDSELRIKGSPGLTSNKWRQVFEDTGFEHIAFPAILGHGYGQQVVIASSDGCVRQPVAFPSNDKVSKSNYSSNDIERDIQAKSSVKNRDKNIAETVECKIIECLADTLFLDEDVIDSDKSFKDYGIDSINGVKLVQTINEQLGIELDTVCLFDYPTIKKLSQHIFADYEKRISESIEFTSVSTEEVNQSKQDIDFSNRSYFFEDNENVNANDNLRNRVQERVMQVLADVLFVSRDVIDIDESFKDYGVDLINGVKLIQTINDDLGIELKTISLFDFTTVNKLSEHIVAVFGEQVSRQINAESEERKVTSPEELSFDDGKVDFASEMISSTVNYSSQKDGDIAIIGMSGRFAGSDNIDEFWAHLANGDDLVHESARWDLEEHFKKYLPAGRDYCSRGGFVDNIDQFDNKFFSIPAIEALNMDPQQRIFLQQAWHALEDAGYAGKISEGKRCCVYVGCTSGDYNKLLPDQPPAQAFWGNAGSILAARIAYFLDLQGPAIAIDTACSSSLVAIHMACQSLWRGETEFALAGGVFIQSTPEFYTLSNRARMLSPQGNCYTFDSRANGFVPGEGAGALVLKRLSDALVDRDNILGVIKGSAMNQDGASNGITAPSAASQERLERDVYETFNIDPSGIQMVEAHGTGTQLGDPIEFKALNRSFGHYTNKKAYCAIGSVKTNIGHAVTAAGVAGVLKILMSIRHRKIPASLHFDHGNENINFVDSPFYVNTRTQDWIVKSGEKRRAAVSSFGISGTNVHMVIEEPPKQIVASLPSHESKSTLVVLSASTLHQLKEQVLQLSRWCEAQLSNTNYETSLQDVGYTLMTGRQHCKVRFACVANSMTNLSKILQLWLSTGKAENTFFEEEDNGALERKSADSESINYIQQCLRECSDRNHALDNNELQRKLVVVAQGYTKAHKLDYAKLFSGKKSRRVNLPTYPFAKTSFWLKERSSEVVTAPSVHLETSSDKQGLLTLPLIQTYTSPRKGESAHHFICTIDLNNEDYRYLRDHVVGDEVWLPGSAFLEMVIEGMHLLSRNNLKQDNMRVGLEKVRFSKAISFSSLDRIELKLVLNPIDDFEVLKFSISSRLVSDSNSPWIDNASGQARWISDSIELKTVSVAEYQKRNVENYTAGEIYEQFKAIGFNYGSAFQGIVEAWTGHKEALICLKTGEHDPSYIMRSDETQSYYFHPSMLDAVFQSVIIAGRSALASNYQTFIPAGLESFQIHVEYQDGQQTNAKWVICEPKKIGNDEAEFNITLLDHRGVPIVDIIGFRLAAVAQTERPLYELEWRKLERAVEESSSTDIGLSLLFMDNQGLGNELSKRLPKDQCVKVKVSDRFTCIEENSFGLDPADKSHWQLLFVHAFEGRRPENILHLWGLDATSINSQETLRQPQALCCTSLLYLSQVLIENNEKSLVGHRANPQLTIVTRGAQATSLSAELENPEQALFWDFGATLTQEHPEFSTLLVDIDARDVSLVKTADSLLKNALEDRSNATAVENRIALRLASGKEEAIVEAFVPRLVNSPVSRLTKVDLNNSSQQKRVITTDKTYVVTGGLGALGWVVVERLIALGARYFILVGRSAPSQEKRDQIKHYLKQGIAIAVTQADVTDSESFSAALSVCRQSLPRIAGVVHTAGVIDDGTIMTLTQQQLNKVLAPKVIAPGIIAKHIPDANFYVMFSSISGLFGSAGQSAYAAANAYMDAWAQKKTNALSLNWGPWAEVGMASEESNRVANIERQGLGLLSIEEGGDLFSSLLGLTQSQENNISTKQQVPVVLKTDRIPSGYVPSLLSELVNHEVTQVAASQVIAGLAAELLQIAPGSMRIEWIEGYLKQAVMDITEETDAVKVDKPLKELGMDSLMLLDLRNLVTRDLAVELGTTPLLELPTIAEIARYIETILENEKPVESISISQDSSLIDNHQLVEVVEYRPVTRDVLRLLRTEQMGTPSAAHNIGLAVKLITHTSSDVLEQFLLGLANRHAALRMGIVQSSERDNDYQFEIHRDISEILNGPFLSVTRLSQDVDLVSESNRRLSMLMVKPFDLNSAPLWRFELFETPSGDQVLLFGAHHAVSDFQSLLLFMIELDQMLGGHKLDQTISNRDVDLWITSQVSEFSNHHAQENWQNAFAGCERLELTLSCPRPETPSYRQGIVTLAIPGGLMDSISQQAQDLGSTPAAFCLAVYSILLARVSEKSLFTIAVPVDSRIQLDALDAFGFFGVPVPLPNMVNMSDAVAAVIQRADQQFNRVLQKGAAIADAVPELVKEGLYKSGAPLVETYFNYIRPGFNVNHLEPFGTAPGLFDIDLMVIFSAAMESVSVYHNRDIINEDDALLLSEAYISLLDQVVTGLKRSNESFKVADAELPQGLCCLSPEGGSVELEERGYSPIELNDSTSLALSASFSIGQLSELLEMAHQDADQPIVVDEAPYHQVLASLIDPNSVFMKEGMKSGVILLRAVDLVRFSELTNAQLGRLEDEYFEALSKLNMRVNFPIIVGFPPSQITQLGDERFKEWDRRLAERLKKQTSIVTLSSEDWSRYYPVDECFDETTDRMGHVPFTPALQAAIALTLTRTLWNLRRPPVKVVAVDGDNTLWKGIAGEIGPENVVLSGAYETFANKLIALRDSGVLILLISKNDENTLLEVLSRNDSVLSKEHFAIIAHGWNSKVVRLQQCASKLNLGLDSFVFLDDNPAEIALVRSELPQVQSVTVPDEEDLADFLDHLWALDVRATTEEDRKRADFYRVEETRQALRDDAADFEQFIKNLELEIDFQLVDDATQERTTQLSRRTNQFNMQPKVLDSATLQKIVDNGGEVWTAFVRDRFGDYGQVCILVLNINGGTLEVVNWMLSCRVLGRSVEERVLQWLAMHAENLGCSHVLLKAENKPRNIPARRLVAALGSDSVDAEKLEARVSLERLREFKYWELEKELNDETERTKQSA